MATYRPSLSHQSSAELVMLGLNMAFEGRRGQLTHWQDVPWKSYHKRWESEVANRLMEYLEEALCCS